MAILSEFAPPWFEGEATSTDVPNQWPVGIAGHGYLIEPKLYRRTFVPVQRDTRDDTTEPGEQTLSAAALWRRSQSDWSLGAGQEWLDEESSTRRRFRESLGVDVFTERQFCLLPETEQKRASTETNLRLLRVGAYLYAMDGEDVVFSDGVDSEQNITWTTDWDTATGLPAGNLLDIATSGSHVFVLASDNTIYRAAAGAAAFAVYYNPAATVPTRIWVAIGRLFMSDGEAIYEVNATPGESVVFEHPDPNMVWSAMVGTPSGVYVGGNVGGKGEVRQFSVDETGAAFTVPTVAAEFRNETVLSLAAVGQNLLIGTSDGFRYSPLDLQAAGLDYGPVVSAVGAVNDIVVDSIGSETFAWFTWTNIINGISGLGRIRLARFAEPKVPAYAADIYTTGGTAVTVASIGGRRYFGLSTEGFYGATLNYVETGTLSTGRIRYGMLDLKVFTDLQWRTGPLSSGAQVSATMTFDTGQVVSIPAQTSVSSVVSTLNNLGPAFAEWGEVTFTLTRGGVLRNALLLTGISGDDASTADAASWAVTDLNFMVHLVMDSWAPGGLGKFLVGQWPNSAGNNAWVATISAAGHLGLAWSNDGTATLTEETTAALGFAAGSEHWVRGSLDVNNGAGGHRVVFEVSDDGVTWTTLDDITNVGTTAIFNSTADVVVNGVLPFSGQVFDLEVRNGATPGVGTIIGNPNFAGQAAGTTSFADTAAVPKTWDVNNGATLDLVPGSDAESPCFRAWVLRAIPSPQTSQQFLVPIRLAHKLQPPWGPIKGMHSNDELEFLAELVSNQAIVKYQEGTNSWDVHVLNYEVQGVDWDRTAQHLETIVIVELHSIR